MFPTAEHARRLNWDGCYNARDLGGFRTANGEGTRRHAFVRSDNLSRLSRAGWDQLMAYGIRTVLDLRTAWERTIELSPFLHEESPVRYLHTPIVTDDRVLAWPQTASIEEDYVLMLSDSRSEIGAIIRSLARADEGGVLFYCHSGKDRTGLIAALLLALVGVSEDDVASDYALSLVYLSPLEDEWIAGNSGDETGQAGSDGRFTSRPETMKAVLRYLIDEYGSVESYLEAAGVGENDRAVLRARLIESRNYTSHP